MNNYKLSLKKRFVNSIKKSISKIVLFFLCRGFKVLYKRDSRIKKELDCLNDGFILELKTCEDGPRLLLKKEDNSIKKLNECDNADMSADIVIAFKSIDAAFLVLTGRLGVANAYAEHRFTLKGDIATAMGIVRCVDLVEGYLFPKFITKKILKEVPKREKSMFSIYCAILFS